VIVLSEDVLSSMEMLLIGILPLISPWTPYKIRVEGWQILKLNSFVWSICLTSKLLSESNYGCTTTFDFKFLRSSCGFLIDSAADTVLCV
jgi:hypothetical protein